MDDLKKEKKAKDTKVEDGVWLTVLPVMITDDPGSYRDGDVIVDHLKLHLANRTGTAYQFIYKQHFFGKPDFELKNKINPFENFYLHDIAMADLNDSPSFDFEFSLIQPEKGKADRFETIVKLKPKQLFAKIRELREKNQATFSQLLFTKYPDQIFEDKVELSDAVKYKRRVYDAAKARQHLEPARSVIDLHIEKLLDDWKHLSNYEIISLQLKTFEKYFDLAVAHHQHSLIVIHGVGEGRLRDEIHDILRMKKEVKSFVNQYHHRFGYGATEIYFQY